DGPEKLKAVALRAPAADFSQDDWHVRGAVDANSATGWAVVPEVGKEHAAVFDLAEPVGGGKPYRITVRIGQGIKTGTFLLGRFRLSFTDDAATLQAARVRMDLKDAEVADCLLALARSHALQGRTKEVADLFAEALPLVAGRPGIAAVIREAAPLKGALE